MNPQQQQPTPPQMPPQQPPAAPQPPVTPEPQMAVPAFNTPTVPEVPRKSHKKLALTLLITPTALIVVALICFLIAAILPENNANGDLFGDVSPAKQILTIVGFAGVALGAITWLPGLIIGIVLLTRKK